MAVGTPDILQRQLEQLFIESDDFKLLEKRRLGFCPFEAMGVVNAEIRHSNFLATMMDPFRPHGFGVRLLRETLDGVAAEIGADGGISRLKLHLLDLDDADIRREWKQIDLLVAFASVRLVVAFELKIGAAEGKDQLKRYREVIERQWPSTGDKPWTHVLLFLTRDGQSPSDDAWHAVTYDIIIDAIGRVLERYGGGEPDARSMLAAYAKMLRKHHMDDPELAELARALWQRHREALDYLMEQRPDGLVSLGPLALECIEAIAEGASVPGLHLKPEESTKSYVRFFVQEWEGLPDMKSGFGWLSSGRMLALELQFWSNQVRIAIILGPGPSDVRRRYFQATQPKITRGSGRLTDKWKRLASAQLLTEEDFEEGQDAAIAKLTSRLGQFLEETVSQFDEVLKPLIGNGE